MMKKLRMGVVAGLLSFLVLASAGCTSLVGGKWVAKVNDEAISLNDYNNRVAMVQKVYEKQGAKWDTDQGKQMLTQLKSGVLEAMIGEKVIAQEIKKLGVDVNEPKVKEQLDSDKKQAGDDSKFQDALASHFLTEQDYQNQIALFLKITSDVKVSDDDVKKYMDANADKYGGQPEQVKAKHILVDTADEAKQIIAQLKAGANFDQLAKEKSKDTSNKDKGGELGYFKRGQMVPEFEQAAFSQKVNTFSTEPVHTKFGYHIIFVEDHKAGTAPDYKKYKDQATKDALEEAQTNKAESYFNDLRQKAKVEYAAGYKPAS